MDRVLVDEEGGGAVISNLTSAVSSSFTAPSFFAPSFPPFPLGLMRAGAPLDVEESLRNAPSARVDPISKEEEESGGMEVVENGMDGVVGVVVCTVVGAEGTVDEDTEREPREEAVESTGLMSPSRERVSNLMGFDATSAFSFSLYNCAARHWYFSTIFSFEDDKSQP